MANIVLDNNIKDFLLVGIDFGTSTIYVYVCNEDDGKIKYELIDFRTGERDDGGIDSMIYFSSSEEYEIGKKAKEIYLKGNEESKYVFFDCKRFLGNEFTKEQYEELKKQYPFGENIIYLEEEKKIYFSVYDKIYSAQDICSKMIERVIQKIQNIYSTKPIKYVISNPSSFSFIQRQELENAVYCVIPKYNFLRLIEEPVAAGLTEITKKGIYIIFDWGAGTLDIAVIEYKNKEEDDGIIILENSEGIVNLGGRDYDEIFYKQQIEKIKKEHKYEIKKSQIGKNKSLLEDKKIELNREGVDSVTISNEQFKKMFEFKKEEDDDDEDDEEDDDDEEEEDEYDDEFDGDYQITLEEFNNCLTINNDKEINRNGLLTECTEDKEDEIEKMIKEKDIDKAIECLKKVYNRYKVINKIIMVGGTSQLKLLKEKIKKVHEFKNKIIFSKEPLFSIAKGATNKALILKNKKIVEYVSKTYSLFHKGLKIPIIKKYKKRRNTKNRYYYGNTKR